jgi:chromosome segregation ATPase
MSNIDELRFQIQLSLMELRDRIIVVTTPYKELSQAFDRFERVVMMMDKELAAKDEEINRLKSEINSLKARIEALEAR